MTSIEPFDADIDAGPRRRRTTPSIARKEVIPVNQTMRTYVFFEFHEDRVGRYRAQADAERKRREASTDRRLRRAFGRTLVRFGERIAADAEDRFQPATSR